MYSGNSKEKFELYTDLQNECNYKTSNYVDYNNFPLSLCAVAGEVLSLQSLFAFVR